MTELEKKLFVIFAILFFAFFAAGFIIGKATEISLIRQLGSVVDITKEMIT